MDSPFLSDKPLDDDDGTLVLADLSIHDEDSFDIPSHARAPNLGGRPAASTSSHLSRPPPVAPPSIAAPSRTKPRFSLFAPGVSETPAHGSTLRSTGSVQRGFEPINERSERERPLLDPPSERSERSEFSNSNAPHRGAEPISERPERPERRRYAWDETVDEQPEADEVPQEDAARADNRAESSETREENLRSSLAELRRINTVFDSFLGALEQGRAHNMVSWYARPRLSADRAAASYPRRGDVGAAGRLRQAARAGGAHAPAGHEREMDRCRGRELLGLHIS